jgi:hypothetical protein
MLGGLEDQSESVVQPREACRCVAVGETRQGEVRCRVVVTIVINRYSQEVSSHLTAQQRGAPVVANTVGVPEVVTPIFNKPGTHGQLHGHGHHLFDPKLRPGGKSGPKTTSHMNLNVSERLIWALWVCHGQRTV